MNQKERILFLRKELAEHNHSYYVLDIQCGFVIEQGGKFVSEILGLTGLSGLGESKIDIDVEFMGFDEDIEIIIPVGLE